jgi:hypothetical protein
MKFETEIEVADNITAGVTIEYVYHRGTRPTQDDPGEPETADVRAVRWNWLHIDFVAGCLEVSRDDIDRDVRKRVDGWIATVAEHDIIEECLRDYCRQKEASHDR